MITLAIADDNDLFRKSLKAYFRFLNSTEVIFGAKNGRDLLEKLEKQNKLPEIILMDFNMPILNGIQTTLILQKKYPTIKIIALSTFHHDYIVSAMILAGARGFLSKNIEATTMEKAIAAVMNNNYFIDTGNGKFKTFSSFLNNKEETFLFNLSEITERQKQFLRLCVSNNTYKDIAEQMNISIKTVENHRDALFSKLKINSKVELVIFAIENGLTDIIK